MQALAVAGEAHLSLDDDGVLGPKVLQRDPAGTPGARVQLARR